MDRSEVRIYHRYKKTQKCWRKLEEAVKNNEEAGGSWWKLLYFYSHGKSVHWIDPSGKFCVGKWGFFISILKILKKDRSGERI